MITVGRHRLIHGDCIEAMREMEPDSVDAICTDPPYGLGFMGKKWDALPPGEDWARECLRVAKPGAHLIAFGGQRTIHRLTTALEDAGWEIRDQLQWLQWQGFPKSLDISKAIDRAAGAEREVVGRRTDGAGNGSVVGLGSPRAMKTEFDITAPATEDARRWAGWGTALKPAAEPCILARKPISERSIAANVLRWGTGAINVDACRYAYGDSAWPGPQDGDKNPGPVMAGDFGKQGIYGQGTRVTACGGHDLGRFPANVYCCPKASRSEREAGCEELLGKDRAELTGRTAGSAGLVGSDGSGNNPYTGANWKKPTRNYHPTVKPIALMRWLVRLITPPGGTVLEPFAGSGTTMIAADLEGFASIGIEREADYLPIIQARLKHWAQAMTIEEATAKTEPGALAGQQGLF